MACGVGPVMMVAISGRDKRRPSCFDGHGCLSFAYPLPILCYGVFSFGGLTGINTIVASVAASTAVREYHIGCNSPSIHNLTISPHRFDRLNLWSLVFPLFIFLTHSISLKIRIISSRFPSIAFVNTRSNTPTSSSVSCVSCSPVIA